MSSMTRIALLAPFLFASAAAGAMQVYQSPYAAAPTQTVPVPVRSYPVTTVSTYRPATTGYGYVATSGVDGAIAQWRALRQSDNYPFSTYATFLASNPGFPGETAMRKSAERAMRPGESPYLVTAFYRAADPQGGNGWARLSEAYVATNRPAEALAAARSAWASSDLGLMDESSLLARFGSQFTTADHDRRADALLLAKKSSDAQRALVWTSPARRAAFAARIAMQTRAIDSESQFAAVSGQVMSDPGLLIDRARYLRDNGSELSARQLVARQHAFTTLPADRDRYFDMLVVLARGAVADRQWTTAYDIARQLDDAFAPGTDVRLQSYSVRDDYTSLAWLGGSAARRLGRYADAVALFDKYAHGGKSLQVVSKGYYWAGKSAAESGQAMMATRYFELAAANPELFYGQLSLERLGRPVPAPAGLPAVLVTPAQRVEFSNRRLVAAVRQLGAQGNRSDQSLFVRALSEATKTESDRILAAELAMQLGRPDLAVWTARSARNAGSAFYVRPAYPTHSFASASGRLWSVVHGITRQESSFDRAAVSGANAYGMMQLLPSTGREQAGKMGVSFDSSRLTSDPSFNVMLGTAYFQRLLDNWGGSYPLAVASYNAGSGNVRKWVNAYGDPRLPGADMVGWIEQIPFEETRGYVQRVLENSVVYDTINPTTTPAGAIHLSTYLGKTARPG